MLKLSNIYKTEVPDKRRKRYKQYSKRVTEFYKTDERNQFRDSRYSANSKKNILTENHTYDIIIKLWKEEVEEEKIQRKNLVHLQRNSKTDSKFLNRNKRSQDITE